MPPCAENPPIPAVQTNRTTTLCDTNGFLDHSQRLCPCRCGSARQAGVRDQCRLRSDTFTASRNEFAEELAESSLKASSAVRMMITPICSIAVRAA